MNLAARTPPALDGVLRFLAEHTGLALSPTRREHAESGIRRAMDRAGMTDPSPYLDSLARDEALLDDLIAEITVGETYFFRETGHFDAIRDDVLPDLLRHRAPDRPLRAWSAGCASGEEPYSIAMVLEEAGVTGPAHLIGTDISRAALARAREARYGRWSLRGVDPERVNRFFTPEGDRWRLHERVRRSVEFRFLNLALDAYPSATTGTWGMDLVLCRNVLIYLDAATVTRIARGLHASLAEGGWLVTGPSDPSLSDAAPFETVVLKGGVLYRKPGGTARVQPAFAPLPGPAPIPDPLRAWETPPRLRPEVRSGGPHATPPGAAPALDPVVAATEALAAGRYEDVLRIAGGARDLAEVAGLRLRALANLRGAAAACVEAGAEALRLPLSAEVQFLHAVLLADSGRPADAERAARRALYLDRSLAVAHFLLGSILRRGGDLPAARRAFRNARDLAALLPADAPLPLGEGEHAGRLVAAASSEIALLGEGGEAPP